MDADGRLAAESTNEEGDDQDGRRPPRRFRRLPTAVTPIEPSDVLAGIAGHAIGRGRDAFREEIEAFLDAESSGTYSSYRRALGACLRELSVRTGSERTHVLIPAFCSADFADAIEGVGLDVRRYDVDPNTLALDRSSLEDLRVDDAFALISVNVLGYGSDMEAVSAFCEEENLFLVEALGYALGASYDGRRLGTYGDASVINFQQGKPIPVGGGMVVSRRPGVSFGDEDRPAATPNVGALAGYSVVSHPRPYYVYTRLLEELRRNGGVDDAVSTHPDSKFDVTYEESFATMSNFQGSVASRVFDRLPETRRQRAETARFYADAFAEFSHGRTIEPLPKLDGHQWVRYPLLVESNELRGELRRTLEKHGVQVPLLYNWPKVRADVFPGARTLQRRILPLPTHPFVDERDRERIVATIHDVVESYEQRL